jgi:hypothetical protein
MFVFNKTKKILIYGNLNYFYPYRNRSDEFILKFINKRYQLTLHQSDFKSGMDMFDFIMDKEGKQVIAGTKSNVYSDLKLSTGFVRAALMD